MGNQATDQPGEIGIDVFIRQHVGARIQPGLLANRIDELLRREAATH